jgi:hypothetical protein
LIRSELRSSYLLLDLLEVFSSNLKHILILLRAKEELELSELLGKRELHEIYWLH